MSSRNEHRIGKRVGVSTVVAIGALATGIGVAGAASTTGSRAATTPTALAGARHAWDHTPFGDHASFGDLGAVGAVTAVNATSITVKDPSGTLSTYALTGSTVFRKDGVTATASAITIGENVAVMVAASGSTTATTVVVVPAHGPGGGAPSGVVTAVSATSITLQLPDGTSSTYALEPSTTVSEGMASASAAALAVGERVQVRPSATNAATASAIEIDLAHVSGSVVSVSGSTIVVSDAQGFYRTIQVGNSTTYTKPGSSATLSDVTTGTVIEAEGTVGASHTVLDASNVGIGGAPTDGAWAAGPGNGGRLRPGLDMMAN